MRKALNAFLIMVLMAISAGASAQKYTNGLIDKTVAIIGNDMIQLSAIEAEVQMMMVQGVTSDQNIRCEILENILMQKLFLTQARLDSLSVSNENIESENSSSETNDVNAFDTALAGGISLNFDSVFISGRYTYSLNEVVKNSDAKNSVFQVGIGFKF